MRVNERCECRWNAELRQHRGGRSRGRRLRSARGALPRGRAPNRPGAPAGRQVHQEGPRAGEDSETQENQRQVGFGAQTECELTFFSSLREAVNFGSKVSTIKMFL